MADRKNEQEKEQDRNDINNRKETSHEEDRTNAAEREEFGERFGNDYGFGREGEHTEEQEVPLNQGSDYMLRYDPPGYNELATVDETIKAPEPDLNDQQMLDIIYKRLGDDRQLDPKEIEVNIIEGKAILVGSVRSQDLKERAAQIAMTVPGVKTVDNRLEIRE